MINVWLTIDSWRLMANFWRITFDGSMQVVRVLIAWIVTADFWMIVNTWLIADGQFWWSALDWWSTLDDWWLTLDKWPTFESSILMIDDRTLKVIYCWSAIDSWISMLKCLLSMLVIRKLMVRIVIIDSWLMVDFECELWIDCQPLIDGCLFMIDSRFLIVGHFFTADRWFLKVIYWWSTIDGWILMVHW